MANKKTIILIVSSLSLICIVFSRCSSGTKSPNIAFVEDADEIEADSSVVDDEYENLSAYSSINSKDIVVPFKDVGGVRTIQVKLNDCIEFPMIFDTGCSGLSISIAEVLVLGKQGCITVEDIEGFGQSVIADGSVVENMIVNFKQIQIGGLVCQNVKVCVSESQQAPLLLGNGVLDRVATFEIDNMNKNIIFHLRR